MSLTQNSQASADESAILAARLAAIVESSDDAIVSHDLGNVVTSWNGGAERILGFTAKEMIGQSFMAVVPPEQQAGEAETLEKIIRGERVGHRDVARVRKDGTKILLSVTVSPIRDASGRVVGASRVCRDFTERLRAEQRMGWLASFPERNPNPIVEVDENDGGVHYMNPFAKTSFPGLPEHRFAHPLLAGFASVAEALRQNPDEVVRRETAVGDRWFAQTITRIADNGRVRIYSSDITARRHAEQALRLSEYSVENAALAIYLVAPDARLLRVNRETCEMLGYSREELCAMTVPDFAPDFPPEAWPAHWAELRERRVMKFETRNRRKDGSVFPVSVDIKLIEFEGQEYIFACVRDITERRRVTALLAGQRDLLHRVANGDPLAETLENMMRFAEAQHPGMLCSFLHFDPETQRLRNGVAPSLPESYNRLTDGLQIGSRAGSCGTAAFRRETVIVQDIATDPLWVPYREVAAQYGLAACWSTPVFGADGELFGTFAMYFREPRAPGPEHFKLSEVITQTAAVAISQARTQERIRSLNEDLEKRVARRTKDLEEANRELESFSYSVSHDLRAPLRHVLGYLDLLKRAAEGALSEKAARYMQTIGNAAEQMGDLIDDLLAFSRMGRADMRTEAVVLDDLVQQVIRVLEITTRDRKIEWKIGRLPNVAGDAAMLKLVFTNLIGNAVKYTGTREVAEIEIGCTGGTSGRVTIFVRDNGVGFDMQYAHKLFGVFQRLHLQEEFEGTGIGLATVRRIVARHGGSVKAEGELNRGATFSFSIGLASAPKAR